MDFVKMHGIGNDFIILDGFRQDIRDPQMLARRLCDRHYGIGADGLILALPSDTADARMRIINSDGSEPEMCGNGIRCLGKFLYDFKIVPETDMTIETLAGVLSLHLTVENSAAAFVTVDMGIPRFEPAIIPMTGDGNTFTVDLDGQPVRFYCVSMGNPHAVTYDLYPEDERFYRFGAMMERHSRFPNRANIEFCRLNLKGGIDVRVWERGDGETLACGTGACAVVAAGVRQNLTAPESTVHLPGGDLMIRWAGDGHIFMTGPAETICRGEVCINA